MQLLGSFSNWEPSFWASWWYNFLLTLLELSYTFSEYRTQLNCWIHYKSFFWQPRSRPSLDTILSTLEVYVMTFDLYELLSQIEA